MKPHVQQTLALAGVAQAAFLVHQLARHGLVAQNNFDASIDSLFVTSPRSTVDVYGKVSRLNLGLQVLQESLQGSGSLKNPEVIRYLFGILYLEGKLHRKRKMLERIGRGIDTVQALHPEPHKGRQPEAIKQLGAIYQESLGTFNFRIQVRGDMGFLQDEQNAARVRAALLAGIRSAVLWRQVGGRRWHLLVHRRRIASDVIQLLTNTA